MAVFGFLLTAFEKSIVPIIVVVVWKALAGLK